MAKNELVVKNAGAVAMADFMDVSDFGGAGFEGTDKDSYSIPFIHLLQKMSPMCDEDSAAYVEGAKAGMLYNTVTGELYDGKEGVEIIPCFFKRTFIHWGPREGEGGGFKGEFTPAQIDDMKANGEIVEFEGALLKPLENGKLDKKKCEQFVDTRSHFILIKGKDGSFSQALMPLSSTQVKASKNLMMALSQKKVDTPVGRKTPPTFANVVKATTFGQSNDKGSWSGYKFELAGMVTDRATYEDAKAFYTGIAAGEVTVDFNKSAEAGGAADEGQTEADGF